MYDVPEWSFHNVARNVSRVTEGFDFALYSKADWHKSPGAQTIACNSDVLVFLWRFDMNAFLLSLDDASWEHMLGPDRPAIVLMVYDHIFMDEESIDRIGNPFPFSDLVCSCSLRLQEVYNDISHLPTVSYVLPDGVNIERFSPSESGPDVSRPVTVGWVGNSDWGHQHGDDLKGRRTIFDVALEQLEAQGVKFERRIADRVDGRVPYDAMPDLYRDMDILVCTSAIEGTPNPVLEAMASGSAIVSTDVGIVPQVLGPLQAKYILHDRTPEAFANAIGRLIEDPLELRALRDENVARRPSVTWETRGPTWREMLLHALENRNDSCSQALAQRRSELLEKKR